LAKISKKFINAFYLKIKKTINVCDNWNEFSNSAQIQPLRIFSLEFSSEDYTVFSFTPADFSEFVYET